MPYTTIDNPELYFQIKLYTGTGSSNALTLDGNENMQPDLVWIKRRNSAGGHMWTDVVRGVTKTIISNENSAEQTFSNGLTAFGSDGFTVGSEDGFNKSSDTFVSWNFKAGGSASSNSNGSITSSVSANTTSGFSIVSYTGNETAGATVGHGLGSVPAMFIVKKTSGGSAQNWFCYHKSLGSGYEILLNSHNASDTTSQWNSTEPTSSVFSLGNSSFTNASGATYIAYCFVEKKNYSKFGSYKGNGQSGNDGVFIHTSFKPAFVIIKNVSSGQNWVMFDSKRPGFNVINDIMYPNNNDAETDEDSISFLSNGFKIRSSGNDRNGNGNTLIYMAFAEAPFVNNNGVPCNAR